MAISLSLHHQKSVNLLTAMLGLLASANHFVHLNSPKVGTFSSLYHLSVCTLLSLTPAAAPQNKLTVSDPSTERHFVGNRQTAL